ncbi:MAG: hypothetical protein IPO63_09655 [Bacteroidetes bacterium]|nr:hypothetical protein [Bacteroidota bacterium]
MKRKPITTVLILIALLQNLTLNAQCVCSAGELIDLNISQDSYCSSDSLAGIVNHASISVSRANIKTGTFQWAFKSDIGA